MTGDLQTKKTIQKRTHLVIVLVFIASLTIGCEKDDIIRIGVAGPQSGDFALEGISVKNAVMLAADMQNNAGGILGNKIQIIVEDDVCKPDIAVNVAAKMVNEGVVAVVGHFCDQATAAALPVYQDNNVLVVSPSAISSELTLNKNYPLFFRTIAHENSQAILQTRFIAEYLTAKRVAIIHDKGFYEQRLAALVRKGLAEKKIDVSLYMEIEAGEANYSMLAKKIMAVDPDVVLYNGYYPEGAKIVSRLKSSNLKAHFLSGDGLNDPSFIKLSGKNAEGCFLTANSNTLRNFLALQVKRDLEARGQTQGKHGFHAHAAITSVFHAIKKTKSLQAEELAAILRSETILTALGEISFDENGDVIGAGYTVFQIQNGKFEPVDW